MSIRSKNINTNSISYSTSVLVSIVSTRTTKKLIRECIINVSRKSRNRNRMIVIFLPITKK